MTVQLSEIMTVCNELLQPEQFKDYCPNGLQVAGAESVTKIISGVTASQALIEAAIENDAQAILVHHGYFWKGDDPKITGMLRQRLKLLLANDISLIAYHLPLDAQPEFGNNASLAKQLGLRITGGLEGDADRSIGLIGELEQPMAGDEFARLLSQRLGRVPLYIEGSKPCIKTIAWCTGAAQGFIARAAELNVDAYLTGEASEQTVHVARETGLHFFAAGHHATERYGVQALGKLLAEKLGVEHRYIEIDNPV